MLGRVVREAVTTPDRQLIADVGEQSPRTWPGGHRPRRAGARNLVTDKVRYLSATRRTSS